MEIEVVSQELTNEEESLNLSTQTFTAQYGQVSRARSQANSPRVANNEIFPDESLSLKAPKPLLLSELFKDEEEPSSTHSTQVEIIYSRIQSKVFANNSESIKSRNSLQLQKLQKPQLTKVEEYRSFMDTSLTLKIFLMEIVHNLKSATSILDKSASVNTIESVDVTNNITAWLWLIEEAMTISAQGGFHNSKDNKKRWKIETKHSLELLLSSYKTAVEISQNLEGIYRRLKAELSKLDSKTKKIFRSNIIGAQDLWEQNVKQSVQSELEQEKNEKLAMRSDPSPNPNRRTLKVRWTSTDGITCKISGKTDWLKFSSVNWLMDKQTLTHQFIAGMTGYWKVSKQYLVETENILRSDKHTSVESLIQSLLTTPFATKSKFVPKEEVQMLHSMFTNLTIFENLKSRLEYVNKRNVANLEMVSSFHSRQENILAGKGKRVPLERWSQIDLEVEVDFSLEAIFCRNQRNTGMILRDLIAHQYRKEPIVVPVETYDYQDLIVPSKQNFDKNGTPNSENDNLVQHDSQIEVEANQDSVIDTCFLFEDVRQDYTVALENLVKTRQLNQTHVELCSDKIKFLQQLVESMNGPLIQVNSRLKNALEYLTYSDPDRDHRTRNVLYFQVIHRALDVWRADILPPRFLKRVDTMNKDFLKKSEDLENTIGNLIKFLVKLQEEVLHVDEMLKIIPGYDLMSKTLVGNSFRQKHLQHHFLEKQSTSETVTVHFTDLEMSVLLSSSDDRKDNTVLHLNKSSCKVQVGVMCNPFRHLIRVMDKVMVNILWSQQTLEENLNFKQVRKIIIPDSSIQLPQFQLLEDAVTLILFDSLRHHVSDLSSNLLKLQDAIGNFSKMVHLVQLHTTEKKLSKKKISNSETKELNCLREVIKKMPVNFEIGEIVSKAEYKHWVQHNINYVKMLRKWYTNAPKPKEIEAKTQEDTKIFMFPEISIPGIHLKLSHRHIYLQVIVNWLNKFDSLLTAKMSPAFKQLTGPKVSQRINGKRHSESVGYMTGLFFLLRKSIEKLNLSEISNNDSKSNIPASIKSNLNQFNETVLEVGKLARTLASQLSNINASIDDHKHHLPQDMSYVDEKLEYLKAVPDLNTMQLEIWKHSEDLDSSGDKSHTEVEIRWESSKKHLIAVRSSNHIETWVNFANMELSSQAKMIAVMIQAASKAFKSAQSFLQNSKRNFLDAKEVLKTAWDRLHEDEKCDLIPTSSVYIILRNFENFVAYSNVYLKGIIQATENAKSTVKIGRNFLKKTIKIPIRPYPDSTMINLILHAPDDVDQWLRASYIKNQRAYQASGDYDKSIVEIKAPVEVKSSTTFLSTFIPVEKSKSQTHSLLSKKLSQIEVSILSNKKSIEKDDILLSLQKMEANIISILQRNDALLRLPDTSLIPEIKTEHFVGILILLISCILELQYFREASDAQRSELMSKCKILENRLKKISNSSIGDDISQNLSKIQNSAAAMEEILNKKFFPEVINLALEDADENQQPEKSNIEEACLALAIEALQTPPEEVLAEHFAVKNLGYVWNAVCGTDTGMILKNHKSHETHTYMRLSLSKRIEIITSVMRYIDQIVIITENNLQTVKKDLNTSKTLIKSHFKKVPSLIKKGMINELNAKYLTDATRTLKESCDSSQITLEKILALLDYGGEIIKNIYSYLNLKFRVENPFSDTSGRVLREYKSAIQNRVLELEITFGDLNRYPTTVEVPLSLSPVDLE